MGKKKVQSGAWLNSYIEAQVINKVSPRERTGYRIAREQGEVAQAEWVARVLPKYPALWSKMKNAERQRRFRSQASPTRWQSDWVVARKVLGAANVDALEACRDYLSNGPDTRSFGSESGDLQVPSLPESNAGSKAESRAGSGAESEKAAPENYRHPIALVTLAIETLLQQCHGWAEEAQSEDVSAEQTHAPVRVEWESSVSDTRQDRRPPVRSGPNPPEAEDVSTPRSISSVLKPGN